MDNQIDSNEVFGTVEAVKTVSDLFMPISGKVIEVNSSIEDKPELVNEDPYGDGWIIKINMIGWIASASKNSDSKQAKQQRSTTKKRHVNSRF